MRGFPTSVAYLFDRQLAEADVVALNKLDGVDAVRREADRVALAERTGVPVLEMSAETSDGIAGWLSHLLAPARAGLRSLALEYERYAEAEAALGWLNATVDVAAERPLAPRALAEAVVDEIRRRTLDVGGAVAHLKVMAITAEGCGRAGVTNDIEFPRWNGGELAAARDHALIVNARVGTSAVLLEAAVREALDALGARAGLSLDVQQLECFAPPPPRPTHRIPASSEHAP